MFAKVTIPTGTAGGVSNQELFTIGTLGNGWIEVTSSVTLSAGEHLYAYGTSSTMTSVSKNTTLPAVFSSITANASLTDAEIGNLTNRSADVVVNAYAIQTDGITPTDPASVWAKF